MWWTLLIVLAVVLVLVMALSGFGGVGPGRVRRRTIVERPVRRVRPLRRRRIVEEDVIDDDPPLR